MTTTAIQTLTSNGQVKTVTVMPTQATDSSSDAAESTKDSSGGGLGTGGIVGIVVGVLGIILIAIAAALFWLFKRRRSQQAAAGYNDDPSVRGGSSMMGSTHPEMSSSPTSNRNSMLAIDPRMDPFKQGLYMRNGSQESIGTIRDEHDYSRRIQAPKVLRATNPDPED